MRVSFARHIARVLDCNQGDGAVSSAVNSDDGLQLVPLGVVLPDLNAYRKLVHHIAHDDVSQTLEFTYRYPLYKGNEHIKAELRPGISALKKFDIYFQHGIADERARVDFAQKFRARYLRQYPSSEGQDVLRASAEVLQLSFVLKDPAESEDPRRIARALRQHPHDRDAIERLERTGLVDKENRTGNLLLFLDHVYNPFRYKDPRVREVRYGPREKDPVVVELHVTGAMPGLFMHLVGNLAHRVQGRVTWLEDFGDGR